MSQQNPKRRDDLLAHELGDETILYDADGNSIHVLNVTSQFIWRLCDGVHGVDDVVRVLTAEFAIDESADIDVEADVLDTLEEFREKNLIT